MGALRSLIKKIIGPKGVRLINTTAAGLRFSLFRFMARSKFTTRLHVFFSGTFDHEMLAVAAGRIRHEENRSGSEPTNYFLRRAIHRVEKGLIMRPRREVFALDYISQTVDAFSAGIEAGTDVQELAWAENVLSKYFEVVSGPSAVEQSRARFQEAKKSWKRPLSTEFPRYVPYRRESSSTVSVPFSRMHDLAKQRRSVRWFEQRPVPREKIDEALRIAALAPSACNRQPLEFRIFDSPDSVRRIARLPMGTTGFAHNIPCIAVLIGRLRAYPHPRDRHVIYVDGGLAAMSFMFGLEAVGLSSCPINWPDIEERECRMSQELSLERDERVIMLIAIGYPDPDGLVAASTKISLEHLRIFSECYSESGQDGRSE